MRFAHIADTHLGRRQFNMDEREEDFYRAFHRIIDKIIEERVDFVVHSGDLFDDKKPSIKALLEVKKGVRKLADAGIKLYTVAGNHDIPKRTGALVPHELFDEVVLLESSFVVEKEVFIGGIPYFSRLNSSALREQISALSKKAEKYRKKVLVLHQGIDKYVPESELKMGDLRGFDYYALGHVHRRIVDSAGDGIAAYPGSTEMWRIDEYEDWKKNGKGFFVVDISSAEPQVHRIDIETRDFIKEKVDANAIDDALERIKNSARNSVVYIEVSGGSYEFAPISRKISEVTKSALHVQPSFVNVAEVGVDSNNITASSIDPLAIIGEIMAGYSDAEKDFAKEIYRLLSVKDVDAAMETAKKFYERW